MKIGIVNDSIVALRSLSDILSNEKNLSIAWTAMDGEEAVAKCLSDKPDLVLMDLVMPRLDGVGATRRIMSQSPCPILVVTASVDANVGAVFEAMGAGAMDVVATPPLGSPEARQLLIQKIKSIALLTCDTVSGGWTEREESEHRNAGACVMIGSSAGGPAALSDVLACLPKDFPAAVVIIQHVDEKFAGELASWLDSRSPLPVRLAREDDTLQEGCVLLAHGGEHLVFTKDQRLHYTGSPRSSYQPSVDVFFESAVRNGPRRMMGVLLTGMGRDGAQGLKMLRDEGFLTVAQDEATSAIYGMPRAAAELKAAKEILALPAIGLRINQWSASQN